MEKICTVHYIQHVPYEGLGYIEKWVKEKEYNLSVTKIYEDQILPDMSQFDMLVVMGGPMGVYEEDKYPWLKKEKAFVLQAIEAGKTVIGICLGAQLIASALGADVYPNKEKEIGWWPVAFTDSVAQELFDSKEKYFVAFQWHGDTFDLPPLDGVRLLASSEACTNQAFLYKENVLALQFHFEVTEESRDDIIVNGKSAFTEGKYIQTEEYIRNNVQYIPESNRMIKSILDNFTERL